MCDPVAFRTSLLTSTFIGFKSLWMMFVWCKKSIPTATSWHIWSLTGRFSGSSDASICCRFPRATYSVTR